MTITLDPQPVAEPKGVSRQTHDRARIALIIIVVLLAYYLPRWVGYDIPNLDQAWGSVSAPAGAVAFVGGNEPRGHLPGYDLHDTYIRTAGGQIFMLASGRVYQEVPAVPPQNQAWLKYHQGWKTLIPYALISPPGKVVDFYNTTTWTGSLSDKISLHYVILDDGTMWRWHPVMWDTGVTILKFVGFLYAVLTFFSVHTLLRLHWLWSGSWFWQEQVGSQGELVARSMLTAVFALLPGALIAGFLHLPAFENHVPAMVFLAIAGAVTAVGCALIVRHKSCVLWLPILLMAGAMFLFLYRELQYADGEELIYGISFGMAVFVLVIGWSVLARHLIEAEVEKWATRQAIAR